MGNSMYKDYRNDRAPKPLLRCLTITESGLKETTDFLPEYKFEKNIDPVNPDDVYRVIHCPACEYKVKVIEHLYSNTNKWDDKWETLKNGLNALFALQKNVDTLVNDVDKLVNNHVNNNND